MQTSTTIGLDIAKSVFQVHGVDYVRLESGAKPTCLPGAQNVADDPERTRHKVLTVW